MTVSEKNLRDMYLDLMLDVITNEIYKDPPLKRSLPAKIMALVGVQTRHEARGTYDEARRASGLDWPSVAHSMIGRKRMANLRHVLSDVIEKNVPGDFVETGVWRGGACIYARAILKSYGVTDRTVWVADSFAGLPKPDGETYAADKGDTHHAVEVLAVSRAQVEDNFRVYGLLDEQVKFLVGWFKDTLPKAPINEVAVLRLDGDMYESTMDAIAALYHKVTPGGYVIVDDYHAVPGCKQAVHDYLDAHAKDEKVDILDIDGTGVFWQRQAPAA
jgi:hypothetical protein